MTGTPLEPQPPDGGDIDVLIVGDESDADEATPPLERRSESIAVRAATTPAAGRELLSSGGIDCVVVGSGLPDAAATEFLRSVRDRHPRLPLFLIGGDDDANAEALSVGVTDYVPKAVVAERPEVLVDRVERAVRDAARRGTERRRQELFAKAQDIADVGAWEYDAEADTLWWSEQVRRIHGLPVDDQSTLAESFDLYEPEDREAIEAAFGEAIRDGVPYDVELRLGDPTDETRWIRTRGEPEFDGDAVVRVRGSYQDVTDLKRRKLQFESLHDASRDLMEAKTRMDVARIVTTASKHILGYVMTTVRLADEDGEMLRTFAANDQAVTEAGKRPSYRIDGETPAARTYREGEPQIFDDLNRTEDDYDRGALRSGVYVPIGDHGVLSTGDTEPNAFDEPDVEILGVLTKLAAGALTRIRSEQALQRQNERLEEFASIVAHDLRNPLNVARGELSLLEPSTPTDRVESIERSLDRMESLIEDVLSLARQGRVVGDTAPVSLAAVARKVWSNVETGAATLAVDAEGTEVVADEFRLQELFENLFRNAVEHAGDDVTIAVGPIEVDDRDDGPESAAEEGDAVGFFVEDDGPGIPDDEKGDVFEAGHTTTADGTGYGLYIVSEIAAAHGWEVAVVDGGDGGARFEITGVEAE
ncbi:GAF domain-containing protein [Halostella sp. JP-L12]|uniref:hybrid sensor histidine kinase/response regulator n=1 Tax=Halostella TaxID=1843185 RepID=UPI000EF78607|nr:MULTISPECIES: ATP-binding protein [Halostella]NHN49954.1 GAF domain-containing protein [Halostella sp. JP-L12]